MTRLIQYSIVLAYLAGSVFLTHVNGAVCKAKSHDAIPLASTGSSSSETSAKPAVKTDASSSGTLPGPLATPVVLAEIPQWQGGGPPCPPFLTTTKWDIIDAQPHLLLTDPDHTVRRSTDRMCCMDTCPPWNKADGTTITSTWANTIEGSFGFEPEAAAEGILKAVALKFSFKDSFTYTYSVATSELTSDTCGGARPLAGKNCQAVIFQPYVMRIRYNATITQSCPQFSDNTYGPSPGAPVYLYNQTVDIPEYYTKNGKDWAEGVDDCWGDCLNPNLDKKGCEANQTTPSPSSGSGGGNTVTINGSGNNVTINDGGKNGSSDKSSSSSSPTVGVFGGGGGSGASPTESSQGDSKSTSRKKPKHTSAKDGSPGSPTMQQWAPTTTDDSAPAATTKSAKSTKTKKGAHSTKSADS